MKATELTYRTGTAIKSDPAGSAKAFFVILLMLLLIFIVWKVMKGIGKTTELISDLVPSTEAEKLETIAAPAYQNGIKWLDDRIGIETIVRKGGYTKNGVSTYLAAKKIPFESITKAADNIWNAKVPFYIDQTIIYNTIAGLPSKAAVSLVAMEFNRQYSAKFGGANMSAFLSKYLKLNELDNLTKIINTKPEL